MSENEKLDIANLLTKRKKSDIITDIKWVIKIYAKKFVLIDFLKIKFIGNVINYKSHVGTFSYNVLIQAKKLQMPNGDTLIKATKGDRTVRKSLLTMLFVEEILVNAFQTYFAYELTKKEIDKVLPCVAEDIFNHPKYPYFK